MPLLASQTAEISASAALPIAITGMLIVFTALILISLALTALPGILAVLHKYYPEKPEYSPVPSRSSGDQELAAAAAFAMHIHRGGTS